MLRLMWAGKEESMAYIDEAMIKDKYSRMVGNIISLMKEKDMSQTDLCIDTGIDDSKINRIVSGRMKGLKVRDLMLIAGALEVPPGQLIEGDEHGMSDEEYKKREKEHLDRVAQFAKEEYRRIVR